MGLTHDITKPKLFQRKFITEYAWEWDTGTFVGRPFRISYSTAEILISDAWKQKANGIPQGAFLLGSFPFLVDHKLSIR